MATNSSNFHGSAPRRAHRSGTRKGRASRSRRHSVGRHSVRLLGWCWHIFLWLLLLGAVSARYISPNWFIIPAYLGLAFPGILLLFLVDYLILFVRRKWWQAAGQSLVLLLSWSTVVTYCPVRFGYPSPPAAPGGFDTLRVLSLNADAFFRNPQNKELAELPAIRYINETDAQIVCLQEAFYEGEKGKSVTEENILKFCPAYKYVKELGAQPSTSSRIALVSKYPIGSMRRLPIESVFNGGVVFSVRLPAGELAVYNLHLESFRVTKDDEELYLKDVQEDPLSLSGKVHRKLAPAFRTRALQCAVVRRDLEKQTAPYVLICGDLNDTPVSYTLSHVVPRGYIDCFKHAGRGPGLSYYMNWGAFRLDHAFASPSLIPVRAQIDTQADVSDHKPLLLTFLIPKPHPAPEA